MLTRYLKWLMLVTAVILSNFAVADWVTVDEVSIQSSRQVFNRATRTTDIQLTITNTSPQSLQGFRLLIDNPTVALMNNDGMDNQVAYLDMSGVELAPHASHTLTLQFQQTRTLIRFSPSVQIEQSVGTPVPKVAINPPDKFIKGSMVIVSAVVSADGAIVATNWSSANVDIEHDLGSFEAVLVIPDDYSSNTLTLTFSVTDDQGATAGDTINVPVVDAPSFREYSGDKDIETLDDVTMVLNSAEGDYLIPATRSEYGYDTVIIQPDLGIRFEVKAGSLLLVEGTLPSIMVGDIVVGVDESTEYGFMRRVVAIQGETLITEAAGFNETFPDAELNIDIEIFNTPAPQLNSNRAALSKFSLMSNGDNESAVLNFLKDIEYDFGGGVQVVAEYSMNQSVTARLEFSILQMQVERFSLIARAGADSKAFISAMVNASASRSFSKDFNPIVNKNAVIVIAGIPILINLKLVPELTGGISVSGEASVKAGVAASGQFEAGFVFRDETGFTPISNFTPSVSAIGPEYEMTAGMQAEGGAELDVILSLYEFVIKVPGDDIKLDGPGLGVEIEPGAVFTASATKTNSDFECNLNLKVGLESELEIDYGFVGQVFSVPNPDDIPLFAISKIVWESEDCPFQPEVSSVSGFVNDQDGAPLAAAKVGLSSLINGNIGPITTNVSGYYYIEDVPLGSYEIAANKSGYLPESLPINVDIEEEQVTLVLVEQEECDLPPDECDNPSGDDPFEISPPTDENGNPLDGGSATGDPHLRTFDGLFYDFQGAGEYVYVRSTVDDLEIQTRTKPLRNAVSVNDAIAVRIEGDRVGFYPAQGSDIAVFVNGEMVEPGDIYMSLPGGGLLKKQGSQIALYWQDGSLLELKRHSIFNLNVYLSNARLNMVEGLLGDFNGSLDDELKLSNGTAFDIDSSSFNELYDLFGESWRVTEETTLFDYFNNETLDTFVDRDFPRVNRTAQNLETDIDPTVLQEARTLCERYLVAPQRIAACILDVALAGLTEGIEDFQTIATPQQVIELPSPPVVTISEPVSGSRVSSNVLFSGTVAHNLSIDLFEYSINGGERVAVGGLTNGEFFFTVSSELLLEGQNDITIYATDIDGNRGNSEVNVILDREAAPSAGGDLIVVNDLNMFDNVALGRGDDTPQFVRNLVNYTSEGRRSEATGILIDLGHQPVASFGSSFSTMQQLLQQDGYSLNLNYSSTGLLSISDDIKVVVLWLPLALHSLDTINSLKRFAAEGGRILYVGEHQGYYGSQGLLVENTLLDNMGALLRNLGTASYCGYNSIAVDPEAEHQVLTEVNVVTIACASLLELGPNDYPLLQVGGDIIIATAKIDITQVLNQEQAKVKDYSKIHAKSSIKLINRPSPIIFDSAVDIYTDEKDD